MKILHVITGLNNGGAEAVLCRLVTADHILGNEHVVISLMGRGSYADRIEQAGSTVECLNMPQGRITLSGVMLLYRRMKAINPDVVQTWMYHADLLGGIIARLAGFRAVVWGIRQSNTNRKENRRLNYFIIKLCAFLSHYVPARIACCSEKAIAGHLLAGYRADKFTLIPNGYPLDRACPDPEARARVRSELGLNGAGTVIGMVARFDPQKDHRTLLRALTLLTQNLCAFSCLLVGADMSPGNEELARLIGEAGIKLHTHLLGPREDIPSIMNALDLHVLSSASEGFPNVLAEAMACGTPCVSTDVGDAALIVGSAGWLVPRRNPVLLAQAITTALNERTQRPAAWEERQQACRNHIVDNFGLERMVSSYRALWQSALDARGCTRR